MSVKNSKRKPGAKKLMWVEKIEVEKWVKNIRSKIEYEKV